MNADALSHFGHNFIRFMLLTFSAVTSRPSEATATHIAIALGLTCSSILTGTRTTGIWLYENGIKIEYKIVVKKIREVIYKKGLKSLIFQFRYLPKT